MTGSPRDNLIRAIDNLARSAHGGNHGSIEARRRDACALVVLLVPPPRYPHPCPDCGVEFSTERRLDEHLYTIHDGPEPAHWHDEEARADA